MMYHEFIGMECIPEIKRVRPHARDNIFLCDAGGLIKECREKGFHEHEGRQTRIGGYCESLETGDASLVGKSDEFLRRLEDEQFLSKNWKMANDVVGSMPDVPAMIAGQPMNMRRRVRTKKPQGPLCVFLETTGSGSTMLQDGPMQRGSAMLALVRLLVPQRPVDVYVCTTYGSTNEMNAIVCKVETMPLDMARACYMLVALSDSASSGHEFLSKKLCHHAGSWSYGTPDLERRYCGEIFRRVLAPNADLLYVPAAFGGDAGLDHYYTWLKNMLKKYGGESYVREDDEVVADTGFVEN